MTERFRVVVTSDTPIALEWLARELAARPDVTVVGATARVADVAVVVESVRPDVVLLDTTLRGVDDALVRRIEAARCRIVFVGGAPGGRPALPKLVAHGASASERDAFHDVLSLQLRTANAPLPPSRTGTRRRTPVGLSHLRSSDTPIVALGASTGGPRALHAVLGALPRELHAAIVVVQHIHAGFDVALARSLTADLGRQVVVAAEGTPLVPDVVVLGRADHQLRVAANGLLDVRSGAKVQGHAPSVDVLFESLESRAPSVVAGLMTGMGRDGAEGLARLRRLGSKTFVQSAGTCVVAGMPTAALELDTGHVVRDLGAIAEYVERAVGRIRGTRSSGGGAA